MIPNSLKKKGYFKQSPRTVPALLRQGKGNTLKKIILIILNSDIMSPKSSVLH